MDPAICLRSGELVMRVASLPLHDTFCPLCGAPLRLPTAREWPRPVLRILSPAGLTRR
jgi:hypothetical protein